MSVVIHPGEYVLTEHKGRFYGVGSVLIQPGDVQRQARCCERGHPGPGVVDQCWRRLIDTSA